MINRIQYYKICLIRIYLHNDTYFLKYILKNTFVNVINFIYSRQSCDWPREQCVPEIVGS